MFFKGFSDVIGNFRPTANGIPNFRYSLRDDLLIDFRTRCVIIAQGA